MVERLQNLTIPVCALGKLRYQIPEQEKRDSEWARDWGFLFKGNQKQQVPIVYENDFPIDFASNFIRLKRQSQMRLEGGNLLATGYGVCLSTSKVFINPANLGKGRPLDENDTRAEFLETMLTLGCHTWIFTETPAQEGTGHIDTFVAQLDKPTFVVGWQDVRDDPFNSLVFEHVRRQLTRLQDQFHFNIRMWPMPPRFSPGEQLMDQEHDTLVGEIARETQRRRACWFLDEDKEPKCTFSPGDCCSLRYRSEVSDHDTEKRWRWRTYTNLVQVHHRETRVAFVPSFRVAGTELEKLNGTEFAKRIDDYETDVSNILRGGYFTDLIWINQEQRVSNGGSLHCLTKQVPVGSEICKLA